MFGTYPSQKCSANTKNIPTTYVLYNILKSQIFENYFELKNVEYRARFCTVFISEWNCRHFKANDSVRFIPNILVEC